MDDQDRIILTLVGPIVAAFVLPGIAAAVFPEVRSALLEWHILTTSNVILPLFDGAGLDTGRIVLVITVLALLVFVGIVTGRRISAHRQRKDAR